MKYFLAIILLKVPWKGLCMFKVGDLCKDRVVDGVILLITYADRNSCNVTVVYSENPYFQIFESFQIIKQFLEEVVSV